MRTFHSPCHRRLGPALVLALACPALPLIAQEAPPATPAAALQRLKDGNKRFAEDKPASKDVGSKRRAELAEKQAPFAIVLTCSDSRVVPEFLFDQGLGDVFTLRVAGNIVDRDDLGSIEYGLAELKVPLVVVLGHTRCGAVKAAVTREELPTDNLRGLIRQIHVGDDLPKDKDKAIEAGVRANVRYQASLLSKQSTIVRDFLAAKRVQVVAGVYNIQTGAIEWLDLGEGKEKP
jgi:carbonic anhydrase